MQDHDLSTTVSGIKLENPFILASGVLDENGYSMLRILNEGAAAVVTKSIGTEERAGYRPPVIADNEYGLLNAIGLSNPGIENFAGEIEIAKEAGKPIIGSIFGSTVEDFVELAVKMQSYNVNAIELNLSCPHVEGVGVEVGSDPNLVEEIVNEIKNKVKIPVFAKLSPNVSDIVEIAKAAEKSDAYVLINTVKGMAIDVYARSPILSHVYGGLSGPAIKPVGIRYVYEVKKETDHEIVGVGGIEKVEDAIEYIMAGASAVQIGTALYKYGRSLFSRLSQDLRKFMKEERFENVKEMIGVAIRK